MTENLPRHPMTLLAFHPPADNERGPEHFEALLGGWMAMSQGQGIKLGLSSREGRVQFLLDVPEQCQRVMAMQLANAYPRGQVEVTSPVSLERKQSAWLRLSPDVLLLKTYSSFSDGQARSGIDPLEALLEVIKSGTSGRVHTEIWLDLFPFKERDSKYMLRQADLLLSNLKMSSLKRLFKYRASSPTNSSRWLLWLLAHITKVTSDNLEALQAKLAQPKYTVQLRIDVHSDRPAADYAARKRSEITAALSLVTNPDSTFFVETSARMSSFQLTSAEIATLWHVPTVAVHVPRVDKQTFVELEPPANLPRPGRGADVLSLGRVCFRNEHYRFGIDTEARRRHLWILGKTGMGKTTLLQNIIAQDLEARRGFAVIEPHGDLAQSTLNHVPKFRKNDVIYFDPADINNNVTFNPLYVPPGSDKTLVADGVLTSFQKVFGLDESQAPRLLHIFRNCLMSLVEMPGSTLMDVQRILVEPLYRKTVISRVSNPVIRSFWQDEFGKWSHNDRTMFIASLQNKLGAFLTNEKLQRVLGDPKAKLDLRKVMDNGQVLVANLSKGRLGENASDLLGTVLVTSLQLSAMSRANTPEPDRRDFSIIIDEFQNYSTPAIATFLSEARKYRTHLILANQFIQQINPDILATLEGNVANQIVFQLGHSDAQWVYNQTTDHPIVDSVAALPRGHAYAKILCSDPPGKLFSFVSQKPAY